MNGFPVVNSKEKLKGLINRDTLIVLISKKCWYDAEKARRDRNEEIEKEKPDFEKEDTQEA